MNRASVFRKEERRRLSRFSRFGSMESRSELMKLNAELEMVFC